MSIMKNEWKPDSWRKKNLKQFPEYPDEAELKRVEGKLRELPELVSYGEVKRLKRELAEVTAGKAFLLQGGDCAETFVEFNAQNLRNYFRVLLQMTMVLMYGSGKPVVKVGRIAGQFAKPRSSGMETINGVELPSYRGDMINSLEFEAEGRQPDPQRLLQVYGQSANTINYLRTLASGGFASLARINAWNMDFVDQSPQGERFRDIAEHINESMKFLAACGLDPATTEELAQASFYTSHEALHLPYEEALTRNVENTYYDGSAHMVWIGNRTRDVDDAHIEYARGIANPVGMKVGPGMNPDDLIKLTEILNPMNEAGKLVLISRFGNDKIADELPHLLRKVKESGRQVIWSCDPMHGNTESAPNGYKTRKFNNILGEVKQFFDIHQAEGTFAGGVHFEMTGQDVTECLGGAQAISEVNLKERYQTACDPRLNANQVLELAFLLSEALKGR